MIYKLCEISNVRKSTTYKLKIVNSKLLFKSIFKLQALLIIKLSNYRI